MPPDLLPADVETLLRVHVGSYEHLAVLLQVFREPQKEWSIQELSTTLRIASKLVESALTDLGRAKLVLPDETEHSYRYAGAGSMDATVAVLAREYADNPVGIVKLLSAGAIKRLRTSALRAFSDAFVIVKRERDDG
jgi:hypothetical protein